MRNSNIESKIAVSLILIPVLMAACARPKTYKQNDPGLGIASFSLDKEKKVTVEESKVEKTLPGYSFPMAKSFKLKACLKENKTERPVQFAPFILQGGTADVDVVTDKAGCLTWQENIDFNFFADESYLTQGRKLVARDDGSHRGSIALNYALNPWNLSGAQPEIVDVASGDSAPKGLSVIEEKDVKAMKVGGAKTTKLASFSKFQFSAYPMAGTPQKDLGRKLLLTISPVVTILSKDGKPVEIDMAQGNLEIEAVLKATVADQAGVTRSYGVWVTSEPVKATEGARAFTYTFNTESKSIDPNNTSYSLLIRVRPVGAPPELREFEAELLVGSQAQLMGSQALPREILNSNVVNSAFSFTKEIEALLRPIMAPAVTAGNAELEVNDANKDSNKK